MRLEMILLLTDSMQTVIDAEGTHRAVYNSRYAEVHTRECERGDEWACINGKWTLIRTNASGTRYVVTGS